MNRPTLGVKHVRRHFAALVSISMVAAFATLTLAAPADAAPFSGGFSPFIFDEKADLNGDGIVNGRDDSNAFYGDTHIIDGMLDCNAWGIADPGDVNDGTGGDGAIDANDDCILRGYNGTAGGETINVVNGLFDTNDGPLPTVFPDPATPNNNDVGDSRFAWSTINGLVDTNGDETIDANDCHFGLIHEAVDAGFASGGAGASDGADVVANTAGNTDPCGFGSPSFTSADNGKVDLNSDKAITAADSCTNGCFFRHNVTDGVVQEIPAPAGSPAYTGGLSPTLISGRADLNYDGAANGRDDANAFYGDTHIIDGFLDCDNWTSDNDGQVGDLVINGDDDCTLIGYDGTVDGVTINVVDGFFQASDGPLPTVFNAGDPDNNDVGDSDFAWSAIGGRVDSNGNEAIDANDCHFGLIGQTVDAGLGDATDGADILSTDGTNQCGFASPPAVANNGLVDLNSDTTITAADSCTNGCFFGHNLLNGVVQDTSGPAAVILHDFDGDGFSDAAFGVPNEDIGTKKNTGQVNVIYGAAGGLTSAGDQGWNLGSAGSSNSKNARFGRALTAGDFDNDGFDDLVVGAPGLGSNAGAVSVIYGSATGLSSAGSQLWTQSSPDVEGGRESGDRFGAAVAAGDLNGDGFSDLAIGVPGEDLGTTADAGAVNVIYGSTNGLTATGPPVDQLWTQGAGGIGETAEAGDAFGGSLASGDLNGDGEFDLVIGASREDVGAATIAGLAHVIYGTTSGLAPGGNQTFDQGTTDVEDDPETGDRFAFSVTTGDLNGDAFDDVAFGVPKEDVDGRADAGAANILFGSGSGLAAANDQFIRQGANSVEGSHETGDMFGYSLTTGDFNGDGEFDLGVGVPGEDIGKRRNAGAANVLHGQTGTGGLLTTNDQLWFQDSPSILGKSEEGDLFGAAVGAADYNDDGRADLLVGISSEDFKSTQRNAGAGAVLYGSASGLTAAGNQFWHQNSSGIAGKVEKSDAFGYAVS